MKHKHLNKLVLLFVFIAGTTWAMAQGVAELALSTATPGVTQGQEFTVDVMMKNPSGENVISVRSWLNYDPAVLEALDISTSNSPFTLSAPGEDNVSQSEGQVKIGRSNIAGGVSDTEALVATVRFKVLAGHATDSVIDFHDYQVTELGHTSVNIIDSGFPLNILSKKPEALTMNLNPGGAPLQPEVFVPPVVVAPPVVVPVAPPAEIGGFNSNLFRPTDLRVNTGSGYVDLAWIAPQDAARVGFNIYYGKTSGQYTRRRVVGNFDNFRLDGLINGETYYFAVTAYDQFNRESDYSNEVGVIINQPLSSTHPLIGFIQKALASIPSQPQNGPLVGWLLFSSTGLASTLVFGRKKKLRA